MNGEQVPSWDLPPTQQNIEHLRQVVKDLETVHNPRTTNTQRLQAQSVLLPIPDQELMSRDLTKYETTRQIGSLLLLLHYNGMHSLIPFAILGLV